MSDVSAGKKKISLVIPAYNEEANIPLLRDRVLAFFASLPQYDFEIVLVDDHSSDGTSSLIKTWADEDSQVRLVRLSRNCGTHSAMYAGLMECEGDAAVFLSADLQDPPEVVLEMLDHWGAGTDVVWATRSAREGEKLSVRLFSRLYHYAVTKLALPESLPGGADFFLLDRKVIEAYRQIPEKNSDFMFIVLWMGFRQSVITYVKQARARGKSKWTLGKKIKLFIDGIVSFSFTPIRAMSVIGAIFASGGFLLALFLIVSRVSGYTVANTGYVALMTVMLVGFGLIMLMLGVMGEYLWRAFDEARGRPRYIVEERYPHQGMAQRHSNNGSTKQEDVPFYDKVRGTNSSA